jgi:hypothetical protein
MPHISLARSVAFLLEEQPLDDQEHAHIIRCNHCLQAMADAGAEELLKMTQEPRNQKSKAVKASS